MNKPYLRRPTNLIKSLIGQMIHAYIYRHLHVSELVRVEQDSVVWGIPGMLL